MRIIKPSFEIWDQGEGLEGIYRQIERAGRVCYKSEDKITETSAKEFVDRMIKSGHGAMLEHGTVYLYSPTYDYVNANGEVEYGNPLERYEDDCYSVVRQDRDNQGVEGYYVTTNYRVLVENNLLDDLQYICEPTEYHAKRHTVKFICDRGVSHEFVRHRVFSFAQESTRYCNYSKDKFGSEITYILPNWMDEKQLGTHNSNEVTIQANGFQEFSASNQEICEIAFMSTLAQAEINYNTLIRLGWKPQQARAVLPNSLKTELVMTGFTKDWVHFFELRDAGSAHPQARELAHPLHMEFLRRGYITDLYNEANPD